MTNCPKCHAKLTAHSAALQHQGPEKSAEQHGSATACIVLGLLALTVGLYFLIDPSVSGYGNIANMHALAVGQALTVAGAVLLGLGIRPG